ncbi:MAG TPA: thioredoxin family protein [Thermoanaerobaculia bacterium]|nr:thioredoxin family protein [Thermoanaerobaculia bacterium]
MSDVQGHRVVSHDEWMKARTAFLAKEKEFTRQRDALSRSRRELPWERVEKNYVFEGPEGTETLSDLFAGRSQLIIYQFMFSSGSKQGCPHCSFWADNFNDIIIHLNHRDVTMIAVSRATLAAIEAFRKRMGWSFKWLSSNGTDYNYDFQASFTPEALKSGKAVYNFGTMDPGGTDREGVSVFYKDEKGAIFHTYSAYARGIDMFNTAYHYLDIAPKGRDEEKLEFTQAWVRHHDRYED